MNKFYLLVLNNHISLCLQTYHMNSFVDITAKRRRNQLSHQMFRPLCDQSLPRPHTLASYLVRCVDMLGYPVIIR